MNSLRFGQAGESVIAQWLRMRGNAVLPAYEKLFDDNKGPRIFMPSGELITPDFLTWRDGRGCWIEAKHKTAFTWHRDTQRFVTGIDLRHYHDYCRVADESPWPVWILFLHCGGQAKDSPPNSPRGLFGNNLAYLRMNENHRHPNGGKAGMVYWAREHLREFGDIADDVEHAASALVISLDIARIPAKIRTNAGSATAPRQGQS